MSGRANTNTSLRRLISLLFILALPAIFLSLYFLKYVPQQRNDFHRRAFLELSQIERAFRDRNDAYVQAIRYSLAKKSPDSIQNNLLSKYFTYTTASGNGFIKNKNDSLSVKAITFEPQNPATSSWQICYQVYNMNRKDSANGPKPVISLYKKLDTLLVPIVSTYKDIFNDYVLILDTLVNTASAKGPKDSHEGKLIFNSGNLHIDYLINTDSLLKKNDGFSLLNIHDVKVEGNPYKLFLYPMQICNNRVILAGLISQSRYKEGSEAIPVSLITIGSILALLVLLNLPLLKIYVIGPNERITSLDIRTIIITYFLAAFMIFFLFSLFFLGRIRSETDKDQLTHLSEQIQTRFFSEIDSICNQLDQYDSIYAALTLKDTGALNRLLDHKTRISSSDSLRKTLKALLLTHHSEELLTAFNTTSAKENGYDSVLNYFFHPAIYPQMDNVFWIDNRGDWVARWGLEKIFRQVPRLSVGDRQYFRDIIDSNLLVLPRPFDTVHAFSIQPTLSRVTGEYNINVVIKSRYDSIVSSVLQQGTAPKKDSSRIPAMLGISTKMHSVCNAILPPGYGFSIVNAEGDILFDSKPGRSLLSNIMTEAEDNTDLRQCLRYRYNRYFKRFTLRGREVDMLGKPLANLPYTLLVSYNVSINDEFQFHALTLTCFCMACLLTLIGITAFLNEWAKRKPTLLGILPVNFQWLRPVPRKTYYYKHLLKWMGYLFIIYLLAWLLIEGFLRRQEIALFIISLSFPFFVAIHYYAIREKQYILEKEQSSPGKKISWRKTLQDFPRLLHPPAFLPLGLILLAFLVYTLANGFNTSEKIGILSVQAVLGGIILLSTHYFRRQEEQPGLKIPLRKYIGAILAGVFLITMVPATSLFSLFYKGESDSQIKMEKLNMARTISLRRYCINKKIPAYRFEARDSSFLEASKFQNGIYFPDTSLVDRNSEPFRYYHAFPGYTDLHEFLFSSDSSTLEPPGKKEMAGDSSWYFYETGKNTSLRLKLFYKNQDDRIDHRDMQLPVAAAVNESALGLIGDKLFLMGPLSFLSFILGLMLTGVLAYLLTYSLSRHIFLLGLLDKYPTPGKIDYAGVIDKIRKDESEKIKDTQDDEESLLSIQSGAENYYDRIWADLSTPEKFILYDFSLDGFTNYKAGTILYKLIRKGILVIDHEDRSLHIMTQSFHNYLLNKDLFNRQLTSDKDKDIYLYMKKATKQGSWQSIKTPLLILLAVTGLFIFFTQEELYQKITGLSASIPSLIQVFSSLFDKSSGKDAADS